METSNFNKSNTNSHGQEHVEELTKSFNHKHNSMSVIVKKSEKISTAIYMVTDFVSESEPMRHELRSLSLELIKWTRKIGHTSTEPSYTVIEDLRAGAEHILVLIKLASTIGIISEMNARIITSEIEKVRNEIDVLYGAPRTHTVTHPGYRNVVLKSEMFDVGTNNVSLLENPYKKSILDKGQSSFSNVLYTKSDRETVSNSQSHRTFKRADQLAKNMRRDDILSIVRNKGRATIKDVLLALPGVGEKTVQRELLSLVKEGVLKKQGEKRWSTYTESIEYL